MRVCLIVISLVVTMRCVFVFLAEIWTGNHEDTCNTGYAVCIFVCDLVIYGGFGISFWLIWKSIQTLKGLLNENIDRSAARLHLAVVLLFSLTQFLYNLVEYIQGIACLNGNKNWSKPSWTYFLKMVAMFVSCILLL